MSAFIENKDWEIFNAISKLRALDFALLIPFPKNGNISEISGALEFLSAPYFFTTEASDWDTLQFLASFNITDVYITEALGFDLKEVAKFCQAKNIKVRAYPNVAQGKYSEQSGLKKFFIRPEDVQILEPYIDTFEFWGPIDRQDTLLHIYTELKQWFGELSELILDLNYNIDSRTIPPQFAVIRSSCGKSCMRNGKCRICEHMADLAHTLEEKNLVIKTSNN